MDCSKCIFAEFSPPSSGGPHGVFQTGCSIGRLDTLKNLNKAKFVEDKACYELAQFCNLYRDDEWAKKLSTEEVLQDQDCFASAARKEIEPTFGIAIYDSPQATIDELETTVSSLLESKYDKSKLSIVISTSLTRPIVQTVDLVNRIKEKVNKVKGITHLFDKSNTRDRECFQKLVGASYFVRIEASQSISPLWFNKIGASLNERLEQITLFENKEGATAIPCGVVRSLYLDFNDYDLMVKELKKISKEQDKYKLLP